MNDCFNHLGHPEDPVTLTLCATRPVTRWRWMTYVFLFIMLHAPSTANAKGLASVRRLVYWGSCTLTMMAMLVSKEGAVAVYAA
jgi:hypothetical protein